MDCLLCALYSFYRRPTNYIHTQKKTQNPCTIQLKQSDEEIEAVAKDPISLPNDDDNRTEATLETAEQEFQRQIAQDAFDKGIEYWTSTDMNLALTSFQQSLDIREAMYGTYHADTAKSYLWLGTTYWNLGNFVKSLDALCRSYRIRLFLSNGDPKQCSIVGNWINRVLEDALDLKKDGMDDVRARPHYWSMLENSISHEREGDRLADLGFFVKAIDEYKLALSLENARRRSIVNAKISRSDQPSESAPSQLSEGAVADVADLHFRIATMQLAIRDYERSMLQYREALSIYLTKFGQTHPVTMKTYKRIAIVAGKTGWSRRAGTEYLGNLFDSILHEKTGDMLADRKGYDAALNEYKAAIGLEESCSVGMMQLPCANMYVKVADIYALQKGNADAALPYYCRALGIYEFVLGSKHSDTILTTKSIKNLLNMKVKDPVDPSPAIPDLFDDASETEDISEECRQEDDSEEFQVEDTSEETVRDSETSLETNQDDDIDHQLELAKSREEELRERLELETRREEELTKRMEIERRKEEELQRQKKQEQEEAEALERKFWKLAYALNEQLDVDTEAAEKVQHRIALDPPEARRPALE